MTFLIGAAFASEIEQNVSAPAPVAQPGIIESILPFILIMAVFYFLIIRPQSKKAKELKETLNRIKKGDTVMTTGGLLGKVVKIEEEEGLLVIEIAEKVNVKMRRDAVIEVTGSNKKGK